MAARRFTVLREETYTMPSRTTEVRKALKKLREIDALKGKPDYTPEELDKLATETYWKNILDPHDTKAKEDEERKAKQYKRHMEKEAKKKAKRLAEELHMRKQTEAQQKREAEERAKNKQRDDEYRRRKAEQEQAEENRRREYEENKKAELERIESENRFKQQYIDEFTKAVSIYKSPDRAFRKLSLKYHPDKNQANIQHAENIQKILGDIRSAYV
uniref:J domain-containing protein n=1 Tax=viral metagenome TaxID=1070528 RepID=A0A6C0JX47_9ZZZZ